MIFETCRGTGCRRDLGRVDRGLVGFPGGPLVDAHVAMERNGQVGDPDRLDDGHDHGAVHVVAGGILAMGVGRSDVEIGDVSRASRPQGEAEAREERATRGRVFQRQGGAAAFLSGVSRGPSKLRGGQVVGESRECCRCAGPPFPAVNWRRRGPSMSRSGATLRARGSLRNTNVW